jgi:hypothetical protein
MTVAAGLLPFLLSSFPVVVSTTGGLTGEPMIVPPSFRLGAVVGIAGGLAIDLTGAVCTDFETD